MRAIGYEEVTVMKTYTDRLKVLKGRVMSVLIPLLFVTTLAFADTAGGTGTGPGAGGMSPLTIIFLGLLAAIILLQLVPALVLFGSLVVAVFKRSSKKTAVSSNEQV
jgi:hypothetical protein